MNTTTIASVAPTATAGRPEQGTARARGVAVETLAGVRAAFHLERTPSGRAGP